MKPEQREIRGDRRAFFRTVAGLGVAAGTGALIMRGGLAQASATETGATPPSKAGYRETEHIRKYYETARG